MSGRALFVTGTDTGIGKTHVSAGLLRAYAASGRRAAGMKPVATGAIRVSGHLVNDDVSRLIDASNVELAMPLVNCYLFEAPASPHISAAASGASIAIEPIRDALSACREVADIVIVEGVGGWCVPLAPDLGLADLVRALDVPVFLVVGIKLGCINHALLTAQAIVAAGVPLVAWAANIVDPELYALPAVIDTLVRQLPAPLAGTLPHTADGADSCAAFTALAARLTELLDRP